MPDCPGNKLFVLQERFARSQLLPEGLQLALEHLRFRNFAQDVALESMLLVPLAQIQLTPVDLVVEDLVVDQSIGPTLKGAVTMIKVLPKKMFLGRLQITKKPASTFCRLRFLIEKTLPTTCSPMIIVVEQCLRFEKNQMLHVRSIVSYVGGNIASKIVLP